MLFFYFRISIITIICFLSILSSPFSRRSLPNYGTTLALEVEYTCTSSSPGTPKGVFLINQNFPPGTPGDPHVIVIRGTSACNVIISNCQNVAVNFRDPITDSTNITIESSTANPNKSPYTIEFTETINNRGGSISIRQFSAPSGVRENFRGSVQSVIYHSAGAIEALDLYQIDNVHYSANFSGVSNNPVSRPAIFLFILMFNFHQGVYFRNIKTLRLENNVINILSVNPTYFSGWPVSMRVLHANHSQNSFQSMQLFSVKNNRILVENTPHTLAQELDVIRIDGNIEQVSRIEVENNEIFVNSDFDLDTTVGKLATYVIFHIEGSCKKISEGIYFTKNNRISLNRLAGFSGGAFVVRGLVLRGSLSASDEQSINDEINEIIVDSVSIHVTTSPTKGLSPIIGTVVSDLIQGVLIASLHRIHSQLVISNIVVSGDILHASLEPSALTNNVVQSRVTNLGVFVIVPHLTRHLSWSSSSSVSSSSSSPFSRILIHNISVQNFKLYSDGLVAAVCTIRVIDLPEAFHFNSVTVSLVRVHELNITLRNVRYVAQSIVVLLSVLPAIAEGGLEVFSEFRHLKYLNLSDFIVSGDDVSQTVLSHENPNRWFAGLTPEVNSFLIFCDIKNSIRDVEHVEISRFRLASSSVQNEHTNSNNNNNNGKYFIHVSAPAAQTKEVHVTGVVIYGEQMQNVRSFVVQDCILELPSISSSTLNLDITLLSLPNMSGVDEVHVRNNVMRFSSSSTIIESTNANVEIVGVRFRDKLIENSGIFFLRNLSMILGNDDESTTVANIRARNNVQLSGLLMKTQDGDGFREMWLYQNKFLSSVSVHSEKGTIDFVPGLRTIDPTLPCQNVCVVKDFNVSFVKGTLVANSSISLKLLAIGNETTKEEIPGNTENNRNITIENVEVSVHHTRFDTTGPTVINLFEFSSSVKISLFEIHNVTMSVFDSRFSHEHETDIDFVTLHHPHNDRLIVNCSSLKFYVNDNVTGNNVTFELLAMMSSSTSTLIDDHAFILQDSIIHIESSFVSSVSAIQVVRLPPSGYISQNEDVVVSPPVSFSSSHDQFLRHVRRDILSSNSTLMNMSFLLIRNVKIASSAQRTVLLDTSKSQLLSLPLVVVVISNNTLLTLPSTHQDEYSELLLVKGNFVNLYLENCLLESSHSKKTFVEVCASSAASSPQQTSPFSLIYFGSGLKLSILSNSNNNNNNNNNPMLTEMNLLEFGPNSSSFTTSLTASEVVFENFNFSQIIPSILPSSARLSIIKFSSPHHWYLPLLSSSSYSDHHSLVRFRFQNVHLFSFEQIINSIDNVNLIYLMNSASKSKIESNFSLFRTEWIWSCNQDRDRQSAASTLPILARGFDKIVSFNGTLHKLRCTQSESESFGTRSSSVSKQISISEQNLSSTKSLSDSDHSRSASEPSSSLSNDRFTDTPHSDTPSSSQHHTSSVSFSQSLPLPPRQRSWQQLFEGSAEIVAVGAALAAGPASFTSMKKALASRMFLDCPSPKSIPPAEFDSNPLYLSFGTSSSTTEDAISSYRGAIVGNAILVIALQVIFISFVYISAQRDVKTFAQKAAPYQYPGLSSGWICIGSAMQSVPVGVVIASFFAADSNELVDSTIDHGLQMTLLVVSGGGLLLGPVLWMYFIAKKVKSSGEVKLVDVGDEINHGDIVWGDGEDDGFNKHHHRRSRRKHNIKKKKESDHKTYNLDGTVRREYECGDVIDYVFGQPKFWRKRFFRRPLVCENINKIRLKASESSASSTRNKNRKQRKDAKKNKHRTIGAKNGDDIDDDDENDDHDDEFKNSTETTDFLNTHGFMFSAFSNPYFMIVDHVAVIAIGVSSGITILCESESCCATTLYTATAVAAFHFLFVVFARPFLQRIEDVLLTLISGAVLTLLILVIVAQRSSTQNDDGEKELSPSLENTINILTMTTIALSFVHLVSIIIDESRSFVLRMISRCKKRLRKNNKHHHQGSEYLTMEELMGSKTENSGNQEANLDDVLLPETTTTNKKQRHAAADDNDDDAQQKMDDFFAPVNNPTKSKKTKNSNENHNPQD